MLPGLGTSVGWQTSIQCVVPEDWGLGQTDILSRKLFVQICVNIHRKASKAWE
jgi:hypothetical protein